MGGSHRLENMIAERLPELAAMSSEERREIYDELDEEFGWHDITEQEPFKSQFVAILEARLAHYREHPETGLSVSELKERMKTWKERIRQSA